MRTTPYPRLERGSLVHKILERFVREGKAHGC